MIGNIADCAAQKEYYPKKNFCGKSRLLISADAFRLHTILHRKDSLRALLSPGKLTKTEGFTHSFMLYHPRLWEVQTGFGGGHEKEERTA